MFKDYSKKVIYRHCEKPLIGELKEDKRIDSGIGRPSKLSRVDHRNIRKSIPELREKEGSLKSKRVQVVNGLESVSNKTVRCAINKADHKSLKKGIVSKSDIAKRLRYCKDKIKSKIGQKFWSYGVSLYLNGTGFVYKTNPMDQAFARQARE